MKHRLLVSATLPPWPIRDGLALRLASLLEVLSAEWDIGLVAPRVPETQPPIDLVWYEWTPVEGRNWQFFPWRLDEAPLKIALDLAVRDFKPTAGLAFFGSENGWPSQSPPMVHDRVDSSTLTAWRYVGIERGLRRRASRLLDVAHFARYEARVMRAFPTVTVVADADARWLRRLGGHSDVRVIPNGVTAPPETTRARSTDPLVVFSGNMSYDPNVDAVTHFVQHVWPAIRRAVPRAQFLIAGRDPGPRVTRLDGTNGITVSGEVDDMAETLALAWVAVAPMRCGAGIKNKILEAWAVGVPVVMSSMAGSGLSLPAGMGGLVHNADAAFASRVSKLLADEPLRRALGALARSHVQSHHSWQEIGGRMGALLREVAGERADRPARVSRPEPVIAFK